MLNTSAPAVTTVPFANSAGSGKRVIPVASQTGITPGAASYTDGFPPLTMEPLASGGIPPFGQDMNGILYALSLSTQWFQAGYHYPYNSTFSTAIGGYPLGAVLPRSDSKGGWISLANNNTTDPDASGGTNWLSFRANAGISTISLGSGGTTTPTGNVLGAPLLSLTGALTANATLVLPLTAGAQWNIFNGTTGAFTVGVQGASGTGVTLPQGSLSTVMTDGVNYYTTTVTGNYLPINGTAVAATKLATPRNLGASSGPVTFAATAFDGTAAINWTTSIAANALSIAMTNGLQAAIDAKANISGQVFTGTIQSPNVLATGALGTPAIGPASGTQGFQISWNSALPGQGATELTNNYGGGIGGFYFYNRAATSGSANLLVTITSGGAIIAVGGFQSSDKRIKTDIASRSVDRGLALWSAEKFCEWNRIADGVHDVGLIAQDLQKRARRYVHVGSDDLGLLSIDKAGVALEASADNALAIEELREIILSIQSRVSALESGVA